LKTRPQNPNLEIIETAARALGPLCDELVFLGGCATALLITDSAAPPVRVTRDVDALAEVRTPTEYHSLEKRLRRRGFEVDSSRDVEIANSAQEIRRYVCGRLRELLGNSHFMDALPGHLPGDAGSQARLPSLIAKLERLAALMS
jgi:hypothetical protein